MAPGGVTITLTVASAGDEVPTTNLIGSDVPGWSSSTSRNWLAAVIICCRQVATMGWLGAPVNRMSP